jgi:hypothetical protein
MFSGSGSMAMMREYRCCSARTYVMLIEETSWYNIVSDELACVQKDGSDWLTGSGSIHALTEVRWCGARSAELGFYENPQASAAYNYSN